MGARFGPTERGATCGGDDEPIRAAEKEPTPKRAVDSPGVRVVEERGREAEERGLERREEGRSLRGTSSSMSASASGREARDEEAEGRGEVVSEGRGAVVEVWERVAGSAMGEDWGATENWVSGMTREEAGTRAGAARVGTTAAAAFERERRLWLSSSSSSSPMIERFA